MNGRHAAHVTADHKESSPLKITKTRLNLIDHNDNMYFDDLNHIQDSNRDQAANEQKNLVAHAANHSKNSESFSIFNGITKTI